MLAGSIILEDLRIYYSGNEDNTVTYKVVIYNPESENTEEETFTVPQNKFFKALAIAVHNDGMPDYNLDYPDAESIQGKIRWIP
jgi:hypothetical protein